MKILFISISYHKRETNLAIDQLCGYLRSLSHEADPLYLDLNDLCESTLDAQILEYSIFGFSLYITNARLCYHLAEKIKQQNPNAVICFGGIFTTQYYNYILEDCLAVDYLILGEGEEPIAVLLDTLSRGEVEQSHRSIVTRKLRQTPIPHVNALWKPYYITDFYCRGIHNAILSISTRSNVCKNHCSFCFSPKSQMHMINDIQELLSHVREVISKYKVNEITIYDNDFLDATCPMNFEKAMMLCEALSHDANDASLACFATVHSFLALTKKEIDILKNAKFFSIYLGIEAGNSEDLLLYNKHATTEMNQAALDMLREHSFFPEIGFINFNPLSTIKRLKENYLFLKKNKCYNLETYLSRLHLYKFTPIYYRLVEEKVITDSYGYLDDQYTFVNAEVASLYAFLKANFINDSIFMKCNILHDKMRLYYQCLVRYPDLHFLEQSLQELVQHYHKVSFEFLDILFLDNDVATSREKVSGFKSALQELKPSLDLFGMKLAKECKKSDEKKRNVRA